jgi:hypothetical protein
MACHPYIRDEFYALSSKDKSKFNEVIWKHIHYFVRNFAKGMCSAWTGGHFISTPDNALKRQYQKLARLSHAYAWLADLSLIILGGSLKRKERLSARLADGMSYLYMAMAALRYCQQNQYDKEQVLHAQWATQFCFYQAQKAMISFCRNFPNKLVGTLARWLMFPLGQSMKYPSDKLDQTISENMTTNNNYRDQIKEMVYLSGDKHQPVDRMEMALQAIIDNQDLYKKVHDLRGFKFGHLKDKLTEKVKNGDLTQKEMDELIKVEQLRWDAIQVDEFTFDSMKKKTFASVIDKFKSPLA